MASSDDYYLENYTTTGTKDILELNKNHGCTIMVRAGASDQYDVEIQLKSGGERTKLPLLENSSGNTVEAFNGPVTGVGLVIDTNASGDIDLEIRTAYRGN